MKQNILHSCQIVLLMLCDISCLTQNPSFDGLKELLKQPHPANDSILTELAQTNQQMGTYWQTFQPSVAIYYFKQSLETYKKMEKKEKVIDVRQIIATTYYYLDEYDKQLFHLKKALQDALELDNPELVISIMYQITKAYYYLNDYESAMEYSLMSLQESHNHHQWMLDQIISEQAEIEFQKGNYHTSVELSRDVLARVREKGQKQMEITCLCNIAGCLIELKQYREARTILVKCLNMARSDDETFGHYKTLQLMSELESKTGNDANAFHRLRQSEQLTAKKFSPEQLQKSSDIVLQAEMQHLKTKLSQIQSVYLAQNKQIAIANTVLTVLIIISFGGIFFSALLVRSIKNFKIDKLRLTNEQITIIEKQNRISDKYHLLLQKKESLQQINESLTASKQSKTELFKAISHDLQTPLIHLQQNLTNLMTNIDEGQFRQSTEGLTNLVGNISLLLENLLLWSKCQSQITNVKPQYTEIILLVNDTIQHQKHIATEKKINIFNSLEQNIFIYADEEMVKCLIKTILQNIIKLSDPGATIVISGDMDKQNGWLQVSYTGQMTFKQTFLQQSQTAHYESETTELGKAVSLGWMLCRILVKVNKGIIRVDDISDESFHVILNFPLGEYKV